MMKNGIVVTRDDDGIDCVDVKVLLLLLLLLLLTFSEDSALGYSRSRTLPNRHEFLLQGSARSFRLLCMRTAVLFRRLHGRRGQNVRVGRSSAWYAAACVVGGVGGGLYDDAIDAYTVTEQKLQLPSNILINLHRRSALLENRCTCMQSRPYDR